MARENFTVDIGDDDIRQQCECLRPEERQAALAEVTDRLYGSHSGNIHFIQDYAPFEEELRRAQQQLRILEQLIERDKARSPLPLPQSSISPEFSFHCACEEEPDPEWRALSVFPRLMSFAISGGLRGRIQEMEREVKNAMQDPYGVNCHHTKQGWLHEAYKVLHMAHYGETKPDDVRTQIHKRVENLQDYELPEKMRMLTALLEEKLFTRVFQGLDFKGYNTMCDEMRYELELIKKRLDSKPVNQIPTLGVA